MTVRPSAARFVTRPATGPGALSMRAFLPPHFLRQQGWFSGLGAQDQDFLLRNVSTRRARRGSVVLPGGEAPAGWHAVLSGTFMLEHRPSGGQGAVLLPLRAGDWLDEEHLVRRTPRRYDVVAHSDGELLCLDAEAFHVLMESSDGFRAAVFQSMAARLEQASATLELARVPSAEDRLAQYLLRWSADGRQHVRLSQRALGQVAGISRQTVNRVLGLLQSLGIVDMREGQVLQVDAEALAGWVRQRQAHSPSASRHPHPPRHLGSPL